MSIQSEISRISGNVSAALTAITQKGGTVPAGSNSDNLATLISQIPTDGGGGGSETKKTVNFLDYDGTVVASYTAEEAAALTALPANPSHTGLTAQGWNYTLAQMKAEVTAQGKCDIGQMYITDDGKTRVYVTLPGEKLHPYLGLGVKGTVVVDWGDGSETSTLTGTSLTSVKNTDHIYAAPGDYVITLEATSGTYSFFGTNSITHLLKRSSASPSQTYRAYANTIKKVEIGANTSIGNYAFGNCNSLTSVTIPSSVTSIGTYAFLSCNVLTAVTIPSGVTSISANVFQSCYALTAVTIPSGVTSVGNSAFSGCYALTAVTIPSGVTSIGSSVFQNCYTLTAVTIPSGVTSIGNNTFASCFSLTAVTIPSGVTSIGNNAFQNCYTLTAVTIPSGVTSIGTYVFQSCYALTAVTIPSGVTSIGANAFTNLYSIAEVHFNSQTPPTVTNQNAFSGLPADCKIYVPSGTLAAYTSATNYPSSSTYTYVEE